MQRYDILISLVKNFVAEKLLQLLWAGENPRKNHYNFMHYFDVILLRDVIWAFGPKVTRRVTYLRNSESHWEPYGIILTSQAAPPMYWDQSRRIIIPKWKNANVNTKDNIIMFLINIISRTKEYVLRICLSLQFRVGRVKFSAWSI